MPSSSSEPLIQSVNALRDVPQVDWRNSVRRVAVILTSSRSGSSLLKSVLASHPGIASLDGEAEPFLPLSGNGFGLNADSDALLRVDNPDALADGIFDGLSVASEAVASLATLKQRWSRRLLLQFPALFVQDGEYGRLQRALDETLAYAREAPVTLSELELQKVILSAVYWREPWRIDYYDGKLGPGAAPYFDEPAKIEEPPFVLPGLRRRAFQLGDAVNKVLLFKSPSDAYRPGLYEQLFPQAQVRYIHLTRGYAQSVNGLMDGWLSPTGFFAHDMRRCGTTLNIGGYSDVQPFGRNWWKFDLPPNWRDYTSAKLEEVCLNQWLSCHHSILASGVRSLRLAFEDFVADPTAELARICDYLELPAQQPLRSLPVIMATEAPGLGRWKKRGPLLVALGQRPAVADMMDVLGYRMEPEGWQ